MGAADKRTKASTVKIELRRDHRTAAAFLDETGSISQDRFFAVGCLILPEPSDVLREVQRLRDVDHWYDEIKWVDLTETSLPFYKKLIDVVANSDARFSCFVSDREAADPVARFGDEWKAYEKLATQLIVGTSRPYELLSVMADNYSTPDGVEFEKELRAEVNRRLSCLQAVTVCRLDSRSCDALQLVDVLTGAIAFEYRQAAGLAGTRSAKAKAAEYVRGAYGVESVLGGTKVDRLNIAVYKNPSQAGRIMSASGSP